LSKNANKFIRNLSVNSLQGYFKRYHTKLSQVFKVGGSDKIKKRDLKNLIDSLDLEDYSALNENAERICEMTDEIGQSALLSVIKKINIEEYKDLKNEYERALYVFLINQDAFRKAEEIRYADHYRKSRMWDGFLGPKEMDVCRNSRELQSLRQKISEHFPITGQVKIEIFDRKKIGTENQKLNLVQLMVYREGLTKSHLAFENDDLISKSYRPIYEISLTYEPTTGYIEVIADTRELREMLAKLFSSTLLKKEIEGEHIPLKQYDISKLLTPLVFPTDPEDMIDSVKVTMLKLKPYDNNNKITLEVSVKESRTIYEISKKWFNTHDPLHNGFYLSQVKLAIHFMPDSENPRGKIMVITIGLPNSCNIKDKTEKERMIGDKYLRRWGLLKEI
jgi:hypothetical protein